jgi:hypothetical protein
MIFNRLEESLAVLGQIKMYKPAKLFVAADGPRPSVLGEGGRCEAVRKAVLGGIDWPCEVTTKFSVVNQGCKVAISSAITWFFQHVSRGIILEDDCVPDVSFFPFMESMLERYQDNERITHVGGFNCQNGIKRGPASYYFSKYFHVWGWATWRRAWQDYSLDFTDYEAFLEEDVLGRSFIHPQIAASWQRNFESVREKGLDTWDYQWVYLNIKRDALSIIPNVNLVRNIGFNEHATHTKLEDISVSGNVALSLDPVALTHPSFVFADNCADLYTYTEHCGIGLGEAKQPSPIARCKRFVRRILNRIK